MKSSQTVRKKSIALHFYIVKIMYSYFSIYLGMIFCSQITLMLNVGHLSLFYFFYTYLTIARFLPFFDKFFINRNYISLIAKSGDSLLLTYLMTLT